MYNGVTLVPITTTNKLFYFFNVKLTFESAFGFDAMQPGENKNPSSFWYDVTNNEWAVNNNIINNNDRIRFCYRLQLSSQLSI